MTTLNPEARPLQARRARRAAACLLLASLSVLAAWVPTHDIKAERRGLASFALVGKNSLGTLDVSIEDKHLFQGFAAEGKNGDNKVEFTIKSAGLAQGWNIEGKNGSIKIDMRAKQKGILANEWRVTGKVGDKEIDETITGNWDVDPAIEASLVAFDL
ncbi:MAG: hypothetical protein SFZ24_02340 [Planctomycetota bacterium]|nr:hypothetical protein [Planctomycetota bacterium]